MNTTKRTAFIASALVALALAAGTALAAEVNCIADNLCFGTNDHDTMHGSAGKDFMEGNSGGDTLYGLNGADLLRGDNLTNGTPHGNDKLYGGSGPDSIGGYGGNDLLIGGRGNDTIYAWESNLANPGRDTVKAGRGNDTIYDDDDHKDKIDCGKGVDEVTYDAGLDTIENCETTHPL